MDEYARDTKVAWREWAHSPVEDAAESGKPVLLALTVPRSAECRAMDRGTSGEPRIAANINDGSSRSALTPTGTHASGSVTMGGFPSTVFLTPEGGSSPARRSSGRTGSAVFWTPSGSRGTPRARRRARFPGSYRTIAAGWRTPAAHRGTHGRTVARRVRRRVRRLGTDVKFPLPRTVESPLSERGPGHPDTRSDSDTPARHLRRWHLPVLDRARWGTPDVRSFWRERCPSPGLRSRLPVHWDEAYRDAAQRTVDYLTTTLWAGDAFAASQPARTRLPAGADRARRDRVAERRRDSVRRPQRPRYRCPAVGRSFTDDERAQQYASRARDAVCERLSTAARSPTTTARTRYRSAA